MRLLPPDFSAPTSEALGRENSVWLLLRGLLRKQELIMPCSGPDYDAAKQWADKAYTEIEQLLRKKYRIIGKCEGGPFFGEDVDKAWVNLENALQELFKEDANDGF